ncbi:ester cyclase [Microbacterium invictum]|uniref:Ester cyclase n=1 Tax=Microbacterium invictum TaxID=515415 RepID=A0ABZ0VF74_9MICO|nr:ester cyclase [Microbacterium invictum]WQB70447.1 ester cyclase [Microbacterium invictum]
MMSEFDIREFYDRYVDAINAHAWDTIGDFMADTVLYHGQTVTRGAGVGNFRTITDAMPDYRVEVRATVYSGDTVGTYSVTRGTPVTDWLGLAPNGKLIEIEEVTVYKIENGRFTQMSNVWDIDALRDQLTR